MIIMINPLLIFRKKFDDPENIDWILTKFQFNEYDAITIAAAKQAHSERHRLASLKGKEGKPFAMTFLIYILKTLLHLQAH